jgi:hypothetical protein
MLKFTFFCLKNGDLSRYSPCSLPDRQLRKLNEEVLVNLGRSLPDRQLRKRVPDGPALCCSSLPDRQLMGQGSL